VFGSVVGAALVALVAHYGYISSDDHKTGLIVAFLYGAIALAGMFGHGLCVLIWKRSRVWAVAGVAILGGAAIVNISNSLDAVIGRSSKTYSTLAAAKQARANLDAEKIRREKRRDVIEGQGYKTTSEAQEKAANDAVAAAEKATKAECGDGGIQRGRECRRLEAVEVGKRTEQAATLANRALTVEIESIEKRLAEIAIELAKPTGITDANTAQQGGAVALARLFKLPTTWAEFLADWKMLVLSAILDLIVILSFVYYEVLSWETREERRKAKAAVSAPVAQVAPIIDITPRHEVPVPAVPTRVPVRPRPKLASTTKQPLGSVLDFLHEAVEIVVRATRLEMSDAYIGYVAWSKAKSLRPMSPGEFFNEMADLCGQFGIPIQEEAGCVHLVNVRIVPLMATLEG
jgi:hypothetical protein